MFKTTAFDIWRKEQQTPKLCTLCSDLDKTLGGGIECGKITELCGGPGTGKTQMCLQLCLTVQLPSDCGGIDGKAIYIDTNQDFSPQRLQELATHITKKIQSIFKSQQTSEKLLNNVLYISCLELEMLFANIILLPSILRNDPKIKCVIIDSFSHLIRKIDEGVSERTRLSYELLTELHKLAEAFNVAVVITNELTTHYKGKYQKTRPALGQIHLHKINNRIILSKFAAERHFAYIAKSLHSPKVNVSLQITNKGIRT